MRDDFPRRIQFVNAPSQLSEGKQMSLQIANLVFVGLAHVENEQIISSIEPGFDTGREITPAAACKRDKT